MNKKGAELSLNVIIVAVIVLIVLVVLVVIFSGRLGIFGRTTASCETQGGFCTEESECPPGSTRIFDAECEGSQICCLEVIK